MDVLQLNHSDISGGAARAAYRIHHALRNAGINSSMWVNKALSGDWTVTAPKSKTGKALATLRPYLVEPLRKTLKTGNPIIHSLEVLPSAWPQRINLRHPDIVHLHWVQSEMLSIADIGRIRQPIVWTLHDMWAFCGAEHYTDDFRWRDGYNKRNRPHYEAGLDLNRWTWTRKQKHWKTPMHMVAPSHWLAECVRKSKLMEGWPVTVIPNPIDTDRWWPLPKALARKLLGLPEDVPLLLFGALGGGEDPRKGFDLLVEAIRHLQDASQAKNIELVIFGQLSPKHPPHLGFPLHFLGHLHDDLTLQTAYSAADLIIVPSRQEAFGQTASEAHACGTPVVAFQTSGLVDIVEHCKTGYLAQAFDTEDLAKGILWVLEQSSSDTTFIGEHTRARALNKFSMPVVAGQYLEVYKSHHD